LADRYPDQLSGGQQQRVALGRVMALEPQVLLLDEPLSNLDAQLRVRLRTELKELQRTLGVTALYVTHDQEEALSLSDEVVVMAAGWVQQAGSPEDVYRRPASRFVARFVGQANLLPVTAVGTEGDGRLRAAWERGELVLALPDERVPAPGTAGVAVVRPERVALAGPDGADAAAGPGSAAALALAGRGTAVGYFGPDRRYTRAGPGRGDPWGAARPAVRPSPGSGPAAAPRGPRRASPTRGSRARPSRRAATAGPATTWPCRSAASRRGRGDPYDGSTVLTIWASSSS